MNFLRKIFSKKKEESGSFNVQEISKKFKIVDTKNGRDDLFISYKNIKPITGENSDIFYIKTTDTPYKDTIEKPRYVTPEKMSIYHYNNEVSISSFSSFYPSNKKESVDVSSIKSILHRSGLISGTGITTNNDIFGTIVDFLPTYCCRYKTIFLDEGVFSIILKCKKNNGETFYVHPLDIKSTFNEKDITFTDEIVLDIKDYLHELEYDNQFEIVIDKLYFINDMEFKGLDIRIKMNKGIKGEIPMVTKFFKNINTLSNRLKLINNCNVDIEDISNSGIKILVSKNIF